MERPERGVNGKDAARTSSDASFHAPMSSTAGFLAKISAWRRAQPPRAERKRCRKLLVLNFDSGLARRALSTVALERLNTTRRNIPSARAELGCPYPA
jgi:hypothetical protein